MNTSDDAGGRRKQPSRLAGTVTSMLRTCGFVLFPRACAGCDMPDEMLCQACRDDFSMTVTRALPGTVMGRCYAAGLYRDAVRSAILAWKDHGDREVSRALGDTLAQLAMRTVVPYLREGGEVCRSKPIRVVPVPSSPKSLNRRGRLQTLHLARAVVARLNDAGIPAVVDHCMRVHGGAVKSVQTRGVRDRSGRVRGLIRLRHPASLQDARVILVDDIVTSASTLRQCVRVLARADAYPLTALLLASTMNGRETARVELAGPISACMGHRHLIPARRATA